MRSPEKTSASPSNALAKALLGAMVPKGPVLAIAAALLLPVGCATVPEYEPRDLLSYLPESHNGYVSLAPAQEPFFSETLLRSFGFEEGEAKRIAGRTERAFLGIGPDQQFSLIALGRYPDRSVGRRLRRQGWLELDKPTGGATWVHSGASYRIVRLQSDTYLITTEDIPTGPGLRFEAPELRRFVTASMGFYAREPGRSMLAGLVGRGELPIRDVYVEFLPAASGDLREVVAEVTTRSEQDARTLLVITRLLVVGTLSAAGIAIDEIPDSLAVEREANDIIIDGLFLREGQIARLFLERVPTSNGEILP